MASAWGRSWGRAWGNSWGSVATETPSGGSTPPQAAWFGYPLDGRRRARDEARREEELVALRDIASVAKPATPARPLTPSEIAAAKGWIDGIHKAPIPIVLPSLQGVGFAFPADQRLSEDEAIALVLLLSEA